MRKLLLSLLIGGWILPSCQAQSSGQPRLRVVGGPCEGCEALLEYGDRVLTSVDTLPGFWEYDNPLTIVGTVYQQDGKTPAAGIIIYAYHTNPAGIYEPRGDQTGWAKQHGYLRGWVQTDSSGQYTFVTSRPGPYPNRTNPEHVHFTVQEAGLIPYYIDNLHFADDARLTEAVRRRLPQRGGNGIASPKLVGEIQVVRRDIVLGLNIPAYE